MGLTWPSWLSWYKKPEYRDFKEYANNVSSGKRSLSPDGRKGAIPSRLCLDRILANKTCSPMSLYDFYMYLKYIEFSSENLEFYMWFKNYEAAYAKGLTITGDKDYGSMPSATASTSSVIPTKTEDNRSWTEDPSDKDGPDTEAATEALHRISQLIATPAMCATKSACAPFSFPHPAKPNAAPTTTLDPLRPSANPLHDLPAITSLFLLPSSPKELNIPASLREEALASLARTSHPDALKPVAEHAYSLLRNCSHRNFVRLGVGNGTFETVCVATVLGWACLLAGFLLVLCRAVAAPHRGVHSRWEVWAAWPLWWLGVSLVLSGLRGSCFFLLLFGRRQRLPWERFDDDDNGGDGSPGGKGDGGDVWGAGGGMSENKQIRGFSLRRTVGRLMIFDRKVKVKERNLRRLQRKIVLQSLAWGSVFATICVALFIWLPVWRETV
ncbi:hypothetical protein MMYC01_204693 [Madurella mycetomatis]|uniref:Uncharacterized protein n=1 Tax=Madurella mycetomatis TaxID=100816 RepID=A0A175W6I0_9PEZI|nr:hypothetical protein MMYC01_204693 [Madurella mycetomatis]